MSSHGRCKRSSLAALAALAAFAILGSLAVACGGEGSSQASPTSVQASPSARATSTAPATTPPSEPLQHCSADVVHGTFPLYGASGSEDGRAAIDIENGPRGFCFQLITTASATHLDLNVVPCRETTPGPRCTPAGTGSDTSSPNANRLDNGAWGGRPIVSPLSGPGCFLVHASVDVPASGSLPAAHLDSQSGRLRPNGFAQAMACA
jgi:hypothetical protein